MRTWLICIALLVVGSVAGCTKLDTTSSFDVPMGGYSVTVDPIKSQQNIKVTGTATGASVNVYLYLNKNRTDAQKEILAKKLVSPFILAKVETTDEFNLEATIPANESAVVEVTRVNKAAKVNLHITNR